MQSTRDLRARIEHIDEEIIQLLTDRIALTKELFDEDADALGAEYQQDVIIHWDTAAEEHGWHPATVSKISRVILELCRQAGEEE